MLLKELKQIPIVAIYLVVGIFFVTLGAFLVLPILALFMRESLGITAAQIGVLMTIKLWGQWGGAIIGGKLGDSIGLKPTMILGLILRIVAFLTIVWAHSFTGALVGMIFLGLSAALFNPASKAALILVSNPSTRVTLLSLRETAVNLGAALGPLIGFLAGALRPDYLFFSGATLYALLGIAIAFILPSITATKFDAAVVDNTFRWSNFLRTDLLILLISYMVFFALYTHLEVLIPMSAGQVFGAKIAFLVFLVNSLTVIIFQVPLNSRLTSMNSTSVLSSSLLLMALGFGAMGSEQHLSLFLVGIFLFSLGEVIFTPRLESDFSERVSQNAVGRAMGILGLAAGLGSSIGNLLGGRLFQSSPNPGYYWQMVAVASLAAAILVFIMMRRFSGALP